MNQEPGLRRQQLNPFQRLPTEIIQYIACLLPNDADIASFSSCCRLLAMKILPAQSSIWRERFKDQYDLPPSRTSLELKVEYQIRAIVLAQKVSFRFGEKEEHTVWLSVLRDMLLETFILPRLNGQSYSKTFSFIRKALTGSEFLNRPVNDYGSKEPATPSDLFCAVQLCLTSLALDSDKSFRCLRTDYDIGAVYSYQTDITNPLVDLQKLNLRKILHIRNFWLRHLLNPDEATFYSSYIKLPADKRPHEGGASDSTTEYRTVWLGNYSCIHPYPETLSSLENRQTCADQDTHTTQIEPMFLQIKSDPNPENWPVIFNMIIPRLSASKNERSYFRGTQTTHGSVDDFMYLVRGFTESIPTPQGDFPGWRRICFAIYDPNREQLPLQVADDQDDIDEAAWLPEEEWPPFDLQIDFHCIHGYEGVILPGENIMIGQWVDMADTTARGPFIFWGV